MVHFKNEKSSNVTDKFKLSKTRKFFRFLSGRTFPQKIFRFYLVIVLIGAMFLYLPVSLQHGYNIMNDVDGTAQDAHRIFTFWDALFVSCSAITDTGLTPLSLSMNFSGFGQAVILILMELGGIGIMTIIFLIWSAFRPKNRQNINHVLIAQMERGDEKLNATQKMINRSIILLITVQLICAFIFAFWLCFMPLHAQLDPGNGGLTHDDPTKLLDTHDNYALALWQALFESVSAANNAGFDIFHGANSLSSLRNDWNIFIQLLILFEFVLGGIGFPLIYDLMEHHRIKKVMTDSKTQLSLFTKVALLGFIIISVLGFILSIGFEYAYTSPVFTDVSGVQYYDIAHYTATNHEFGKLDTFNRVWAIFFNSMSTRSVGMFTVNSTVLSPGSQWTYTLLMFVGGSPSSTAGGIRTTTLIVIFACIIAKIRGLQQTRLFHRGISHVNVLEAFSVTIVAAILLALASVVVFYDTPTTMSSLPRLTMLGSFFETASAFGTVGLSVGVTTHVGHAGQIALILMMFIGQLGVTATLLSWTKKSPKGNHINYPIEEVKVG